MSEKSNLVGAGVVLGVVFGAAGVLELVRGMWIDATIWLALGVAMIASLTPTAEAWYQRPRWFRALVMLVTAGALVAFGWRIWLDSMG